MESLLYRCPSTNCKEMVSSDQHNVGYSQGLFDLDYEIVCKNGFYLADNITDAYYKKWFSSKCINVLNKSQCGNGGTTGFIRYALAENKGLLVLVPNISICKSKEKEYKDDERVCCIYGGKNGIRLDAKVIIATYDQMHKMLTSMSDCGVDYNEDWTSKIWSDRLIVLDEYHKLITECGYRNICYSITKMLKYTNYGVMLMSATPNLLYIKMLKKYSGKEVVSYTIKYNDDKVNLMYKVEQKHILIYNVEKKNADIIYRTYLAPQNEQIVIFYNNLSAIVNIVQKMNTEDAEILCSADQKEKVGEFYSDTFNSEKKLHFLTSAFFTGCDINIKINKCIIIGSKSNDFLSYGCEDIQQMIGRFRGGCGSVHIFFNGLARDMWNYVKLKSHYDENVKLIETLGDKCFDDDFIGKVQEALMQRQTLKNWENWESIDKLMDAMNQYGYVVKKGKMKEFEDIISPKKLTPKQCKELICKGVKVNWLQNKNCNIYQAYYDHFGKDRFEKAPIRKILDWYKINKNVGDDVDRIDSLLPSELCDAVGLSNGYYRASYLMSLLDYIGVEYSDEILSLRLLETFNVFAIMVDKGRRPNSDTWLVLHKMRQKCENTPYIYNDSSHTLCHNCGKIVISYKMHYSDRHTIAKSFYLDEKMTFQSLKGITLYDWVNEDKEHRLPLRKKDKDWTDIKNYKQSKISEMFKFTNESYRQVISECTHINSLVCDIDSGLKFGEFKERYKKYKWTAYPTLSNITSDWTKFRVIVPLGKMIELEGEYNLKVLRLLRQMFCPFEDSQHMMVSYVNQEDWNLRIENDGEYYNIEQSFVDYLHLQLKNLKEFKELKKYKPTSSIISSASHSYITLDMAKEYFENSFKLGDGARHKTLFLIKNRLSADDKDLFEDWLKSNHPKHIINWRSHKVV